jgi:hypothetical protein
MTDTTKRLREHYSATDLTDRIKSALATIVPEDWRDSRGYGAYALISARTLLNLVSSEANSRPER